MSDLFALRALLFAGEWFLGGALILAAARLATQGICRTASLRHLVWLAAFGAVLALPVLAAIVPPQFVIVQAASEAASVPDAVMLAAVNAPPPADPSLNATMLATLLFAVWGAGFLWIALRGAIGFIGLRMLYRRSVPYFLESVDASKLTVAGRNWKLRLSTSPRGTGPITWGILRPVVLLPKAAVLWPRDRLEAVLLHELAHVRRYDSLAQAISLLVCALTWPNPLVWMGARAMRREAEIAADDAVIVSGVKPSAYAGQLLKLAEEFRHERMSFAGLSMAAPSALEARVKSVLAPTQSRSGVTPMNAWKIASLALLATSLLALARPSVAEAQDASEPVAPVIAAEPAQPSDPAPPAPAAEPVPPAPIAAPAPLVAPAPVVLPAPAAVPRDQERAMRHARAEMKKAQAEMRKAHADMQKAMAQIQPAIDKALAEAHINEQVVREMARRAPQIDAAVAQAMQQAKPEIDKALAQAKIAETVARAMEKAQPDIEKALARAHEQAEEAARRDRAEPAQNGQ